MAFARQQTLALFPDEILLTILNLYFNTIQPKNFLLLRLVCTTFLRFVDKEFYPIIILKHLDLLPSRELNSNFISKLILSDYYYRLSQTSFNDLKPDEVLCLSFTMTNSFKCLLEQSKHLEGDLNFYIDNPHFCAAIFAELKIIYCSLERYIQLFESALSEKRATKSLSTSMLGNFEFILNHLIFQLNPNEKTNNEILKFSQYSNWSRFITLSGFDFSSLFFQLRNADRLNFEACNFKGMTISTANFSFSNLNNTNLEGTSFIDCIFNKTSFRQARIKNTRFIDCIFYENNFSYMDMQKVSFLRGEIRRCAFIGAIFNEARLHKVQLEECEFNSAKFVYTSFTCASIINCSFLYIELQATDLSFSTISNVALRGKLSLSNQELLQKKDLFSVYSLKNELTCIEKVSFGLHRSISFDFSNYTLLDWNFMDLNLNSCKFNNTTFIRIDFTHADFAAATDFSTATFYQCSFLGLHFNVFNLNSSSSTLKNKVEKIFNDLQSHAKRPLLQKLCYNEIEHVSNEILIHHSHMLQAHVNELVDVIHSAVKHPFFDEPTSFSVFPKENYRQKIFHLLQTIQPILIKRNKIDNQPFL